MVPSAVRRDARTAPWRAGSLALLLVPAACSGGGGGGSDASAGRLSVTVSKLSFGDRDDSDATFEVGSGGGRLDFTNTVDEGSGPPGWLSVFPTSGSSNGQAA